jgi:hypothetical protein
MLAFTIFFGIICLSAGISIERDRRRWIEARRPQLGSAVLRSKNL